MNVKRILKVMTIMLVICLAIISPCYAARIYNNTDTFLTVKGNRGFGGPGDPSAGIRAKERSDSLNWQIVTDVTAFKGDSTFCKLNFGAHNQIVGGNYMIIEQSANCFVCDSNHKPIVGNGSC